MKTKALSKHQIKRLYMAFIGVALSGICVGIFNTALLGADPFTVFVTGSGNLFGLSYGNIYTIVTGVFLLAVFLLDRHYIGIATIFNLFGIGYIAQFTMYLIEQVYQGGGSMPLRLGMFLFGLLLLCFGSSLYFVADLGVSAYDAIALILAKRTPVPFRFCRIGTDTICVIIGFSLHAVIGIGTLITAFFMGPIIQWFVDHFAKPFLEKTPH